MRDISNLLSFCEVKQTLAKEADLGRGIAGDLLGTSNELSMTSNQWGHGVQMLLLCLGPSWHAFVFYKVLSHSIY